jgi:hypothetical protein
VLPEQPRSAVAEAEDGEEERLSSLVWIACADCRVPVRLSDTIRGQDGRRLCPECSSVER